LSTFCAIARLQKKGSRIACLLLLLPTTSQRTGEEGVVIYKTQPVCHFSLSVLSSCMKSSSARSYTIIAVVMNTVLDGRTTLLGKSGGTIALWNALFVLNGRKQLP